jgi:hypothetical protein
MKKRKNVNKSVRNYHLIAFGIGLLTFLIQRIARNNKYFAEWISLKIGTPIRMIMAKLFVWFRASFAELIIIVSPLIIFLVIFFAAKQKGAKARVRYMAGILAVVCIFYSIYAFTLGIGYHRLTISEKMKLTDVEVTRENLYSTLLRLESECTDLIDKIEFDSNGSSIMPGEFEDVSKAISDAYYKLDEDYPELMLKPFDSVAKPVKISKVMSMFEILGIYTFFTGESCVNVHYPDYTVPFTIAHELAHQRGISRENEANFIAFLVCIRSDDAYTRYSGYLNMYEYIASALAKTDKELLKEAYASLDDRIYGEMVAYSKFYNENKNELTANISNFFNDNYLKAQGTAGVLSYGLVVELCVSYFEK